MPFPVEMFFLWHMAITALFHWGVVLILVYAVLFLAVPFGIDDGLDRTAVAVIQVKRL